jgi:signal transduction histidine kinase
VAAATRGTLCDDPGVPSPPISPPPAVPPPPAPDGAVPSGGSRWTLGLTRREEGRVVAGVAAGLGARLGVDPVLIRIGIGLLVFAGGVGVLLYALAWALLPLAEEDGPPRRTATTQQGVALALITLGVLLLLRVAGLWFGDALMFPLVLAAAASAVLWWRSDEEQRQSWQRRALGPPRPGDATSRRRVLRSAASAPVSPVRVVIGTVLIAGAIAGFVAATDAVTAAQDLLVAVVTATAGIALLFGPWLWRVLDQLGAERRARIRQEERAELAAHLHDSVLQTLALIQRSSDQPRRMVALARRQERELRAWLYAGGPDTGPATTLEQAVTEVAEEVETLHDVSVEVVVVGDLALDASTGALVAALREAMVNAAKHAGVDRVDAYLEVEEDEVQAFVRDRGVGFDPEAVPADRQGIARSIVARVERHGGACVVRSDPGAGTEIELRMPRERERQPS